MARYASHGTDCTDKDYYQVSARPTHTVMAWLGQAIHVFGACSKERRVWPSFAGHDEMSLDQRALVQ